MGRFMALRWSSKAIRIVAATSVLVVMAAAGPIANAQSRILYLDTAIQLALVHYPAVTEAALGRLSREIALDKQLAAYSPQLAITSFKPLALTGGSGRGVKLEPADGLTLRADVMSLQGWSISAMNRIKTEEYEKAGITLTASLDLWPPARYSSENLALLNTRESLAFAVQKEVDASRTVVIETYQRYRSLQISYAQLALHQAQQEAAEIAYERVVAKAEEGYASAGEVADAAEERAKVRAVCQRAARDQQREWKAFLSDLGQEGDWKPEPLTARPNYGHFVLTEQEVIEAALAHDTGVGEARQAVTTAQRKVEAIAISRNVELKAHGEANLIERQAEGANWSIYLSLNYPLLDGGKRRFELQEAEIATKQAEEALTAKEKQLNLNVAKGLSDLEWLESQAEMAGVHYRRMQSEHETKLTQAADGLLTEVEIELHGRTMEQAWLDWHEAAVAYEAARLQLMALASKGLDVEGEGAL